jgi:hypothetical protein
VVVSGARARERITVLVAGAVGGPCVRDHYSMHGVRPSNPRPTRRRKHARYPPPPTLTVRPSNIIHDQFTLWPILAAITHHGFACSDRPGRSSFSVSILTDPGRMCAHLTTYTLNVARR